MTNQGLPDALPSWWGRCLRQFCADGWDVQSGLLYEKLNIDGIGVSANHRALVHARQLYVYSYWGKDDPNGAFSQQADKIYDCLINRFYDHDHGGWFCALDSDGDVIDGTKQLYTHAFIMFGLCAYAHWRPQGNANFWAGQTAVFIEQKFRQDNGLYAPQTNQSGDASIAGFQQNPMMHLLEALLLRAELFKDQDALGQANALASTACEHFSHNGFLIEHIDADLGLHPRYGALCEPGHQFEWSWLLNWLMRLNNNTEHEQFARQLVQNAMRYGWDHEHGGIFDAIDARTHAPIKTDKRIWPLCELIKIAKLRAEYLQEFDLSYTDFISFLGRHYLHDDKTAKRMWYEWLRSDLSVRNMQPDDNLMPASTCYHLSMALAEIDMRLD